MLLGHAHPSVVAAVRDALERGSSYLMVNEPSLLLAEEIVKAIPCAEKICFNSSGKGNNFKRRCTRHQHAIKIIVLCFDCSVVSGNTGIRGGIVLSYQSH